MTDNTLREAIVREYYDENNAFSSDLIFKKLRPTHPNLTKRLIQQVINTQESKQLFTKTKSQSKHKLVIPRVPFARVQIDLLDLSNMIPNQNKGMKWLFVLIDAYTKIAYAEPMKKKDTTDCLAAFKKIHNDIWEKYNEMIQRIDLDNEKAFESKSFTTYCKEMGIELNFSRPYDSRSKAFIESFNRTLREKIQTYKAAKNTNNWVDFIPKLIKGYNNTRHSTLKISPEEAVIDNPYLDEKIKEEEETKTFSKLRIGDLVRVLLHRTNFEKGTERKWSTDIHKIEKIELGNKYFVSDRKNYYKDYELLVVGEVEKKREDDVASQEQKVEKIERRITRRISKEGIEKNIHEQTDEEKTERAIRGRKQRDFGPYYSYY